MAQVFRKNGNFWIDYNLANGKRRREKVGKNKALATQVLGQRLQDVTKEIEFGIKQPKKITFSKFADEFLEKYSKPNKKSWSRDEIILRKHLKPFFEPKLLSEITALDMEDYKVARMAKVKKSSVNRELDCLRTLFRKAVEWGKLEKNPALEVKDFKLDNRRLVFLERDECQRLLGQCHGLFRHIVEVFILTGLRKGELFHLKWYDIDFSAGVIHVLNGKSGKPRQIPMNRRLRAILGRIPRHIGTDYVFCRPDGRPFTDVRKSLQSALKRAGISKRVTFHTLRHTYASHMVMAGTDLYTVSELLGHASIEMTQRYAHLSADHKSRAMDRLDRYFEQQSQEKLVEA